MLARLSAYFGAHLNVQFNDLSPAALSTGDFYAWVEMYQPNETFVSQMKYLSAKFVSAKWNICQPIIYQPIIYQPNETFISQLKYLSAKWEYLSAKLRVGWRPKP